VKGGGCRVQGRRNPTQAEMCSGSEAGSYLKLIDFVYHSTLGLRVITKRREVGAMYSGPQGEARRTARP